MFRDPRDNKPSKRLMAKQLCYTLEVETRLMIDTDTSILRLAGQNLGLVTRSSCWASGYRPFRSMTGSAEG